MKLKQLPDDFIVEEINSFDFKADGNYKIYLLEKKSIDTFGALNIISKRNNIPRSKIGIAGLKDKHAITNQYISVPKEYDLGSNDEINLKLSLLGYSDNPISIGDLAGNKFTIVVRGIDPRDIGKYEYRVQNVKKNGVPNYFDSQRFGSLILGEFIAKCLIQKDYEKAVKIYLTEYTKNEKSEVKVEKRLILDNWQNLDKIFGRLENNEHKKIIGEYIKEKDWLFAYQSISSNIRELHISAYQSYIWNECVKSLLFKYVDKKNLYSVKYNAGTLIYFKDISSDEVLKLPEYFNLVSHNGEFTELEKNVLEYVLRREKIALSDFNISKIGNFFKSSKRKIFSIPSGLDYSFSLDEINSMPKNESVVSNRDVQKMKIMFFLPKGSYATVITKGIFNK